MGNKPNKPGSAPKADAAPASSLNLSFSGKKPSGGSKESSAASSSHDVTGDLQPVLLGSKLAKKPSKESEDDNPERTTLYEHLVAFYFRFDNERLIKGEVDVDGICDWTLQAGDEGMDALNARLKKKYGSDMDEFLLALAIEPFDEEEDDDDEDVSPPPPPTEPFPGEAPVAPPEAVLSRPTIPSERRRRPTIEGVKVGADGQVVPPAPDHPAPPNLSEQLESFLAGQADSTDKAEDLKRYAKVAADHGLVALNSELLARFGANLKGDTVAEPSVEHHDATRFGVGMDNKILLEMQTAALRHDSGSNRSLSSADSTHACSKFRLDTKATTFGMCKCGFDRQAHLLQMSRESTGMSSSLRRKLEKRVQTTTLENKPPPPAKPAAPSTPSSQTAAVAPVKPPTPSPAPPVPVVVAAAAAAPIATTTTTLPQISAPKDTIKSSASQESLRSNRSPSMESAGKPAPPLQPKVLNPKRPLSRKAVGGLERIANSAPKEKKPQACSASEFQLDMGASEFGVCRNCGWKKADHTAGAAAAAEHVPVEVTRPVSVRKDGPPLPCENYKLDVNADTFGVCTCGFSRQAHKGQSTGGTKVSKTLEKRWQQVKL